MKNRTVWLLMGTVVALVVAVIVLSFIAYQDRVERRETNREALAFFCDQINALDDALTTNIEAAPSGHFRDRLLADLGAVFCDPERFQGR